MRIVIVGGAGFIGSALTQELLLNGHSVCVLDRLARLEKMKGSLVTVDRVALDFPDMTKISRLLGGADAIAHLACTTDPSRSMDSMIYDAETNIIPSIVLFEAAAKLGIKRIVFSSSGGTVYGQPMELPVRESHATNPICAYGVSKLALEKYLALFEASYGIEGISLRIANPYGPFQLRGTKVGVIARYLSELNAGHALEVWGDGTIVRDYVHVEDVARAMVKALTTNLSSGTYNIGTGVGFSINQIIDLIFDITECAVPVCYSGSRPYDVHTIVLDNQRFRAATNWAPEVTLRDGIEAMWSSMRDFS